MRHTQFSIICLSLLAFSLFGGMGNASAQELLSLDQAIANSLQYNYAIRINQYDIQSAESDVYRGNAGLLPTLALQGGANYNNNNAEVDVVAGTDPTTGAAIIEKVSANGVETSSANLGLNLNWTVYNGMANTRRYQLLAASADLTKEQTRTLVESNILSVANAYYQLARLEKSYLLQQQNLVQSKERLAFVQNQAEFGVATSLAVLNAQVDVNTDSVNLVTTSMSLENARRSLNYLIGSDLDEETQVDLNVEFGEVPEIDELEGLVKSNNASIRTAEQSRQLSQLSLNIAESGHYPTVSVNGSYGLNYANNGPFSFAPRIFSYGFAGGVSVNVPIYSGSRISNGIQKAEIGVAKSNLQVSQAQQQALRDLRNAYYTYRNNIEILRLQQLSVQAASENFERTKERFELGQATSISFRDAQVNLLLAENRLNEAGYDAKLSELALLQITGSLLPE